MKKLLLAIASLFTASVALAGGGALTQSSSLAGAGLDPASVTASTLTATNTGTHLSPSASSAPVHIQLNGQALQPVNGPWTNGLIIESGQNNGTSSLEFLQKGAGKNFVYFNMNGTADDGYLTYDVTGAADFLGFNVANANRARITSTGLHVGGADANPAQALDVTGSGVFSSSVVAVGGPFSGPDLHLTYGIRAATITLNQAIFGETSITLSTVTTAVISGSSFAGSTFTQSGVNLRGTNTNDTAAAGYVGELITASLGSVQTLSASNSFVSISTLTLSPGEWDINGTCALDTAGTTAGTKLDCLISTTPSGTGGGSTDGETIWGQTLLVNNNLFVPVGPKRVRIAATTIYYLVGSVTFTTDGGASWDTASNIRATRIR